MKPGELKEYFNVVMKSCQESFALFPWEDPIAYGHWLKQTHYFVVNSTRLFALASSRFPTERNDRHKSLIKHCQEEMGHETLLTRDISALGLKFEDLKVTSFTKALYQTQHYWIERVSPVAFYGYILYLEGLAVHHAAPVMARIEKAHGLKPMSFLKVHSDEDIEHLEKAFNTLKDINQAETEWICENMEMSCSFYTAFLGEIRQKYCASSAKNKKSA